VAALEQRAKPGERVEVFAVVVMTVVVMTVVVMTVVVMTVVVMTVVVMTGGRRLAPQSAQAIKWNGWQDSPRQCPSGGDGATRRADPAAGELVVSGG
jgi:hypothetical protein